MKKTFAFLMAGIMALGLVACGRKNVAEEPENDAEDTDVVTKINMVYGDDETVVTLHKPKNAEFTLGSDTPLDAGDLVGICADDYSWDGEIMGYKYYEGIGSNVPFVDQYFAGKVNSEKYTSYEETLTELGIDHMGKPVVVIRYTYTRADDDEEYSECFVGFEYNGTNDCGLMGVKITPFDEAPSDNQLRSLFDELFFIER